MANATGEWISAGDVSMPLMILTYEDHMDEVGRIWMARSILTGHVTAGTTDERARECLRRTVAGSIELAKRYGKPFDEWFREQRPAERQYVEQYFRAAADKGREVAWSSPGRNLVALAPD
jgi:hypothetical protein